MVLLQFADAIPLEPTTTFVPCTAKSVAGEIVHVTAFPLPPAVLRAVTTVPDAALHGMEGVGWLKTIARGGGTTMIGSVSVAVPANALVVAIKSPEKANRYLIEISILRKGYEEAYFARLIVTCAQINLIQSSLEPVDC